MNFVQRTNGFSFAAILPPATRGLLLLSFCAAMMAFSGCRPVTRMVTTFRNKGYPEKAFEGYRDYVWAKRAYNLRYGNCKIGCGEDFQSGFIEGYCSMCEGGNGTTPALPPDQYWSQRYQSANGKKAVQAWFRGYPEGVRAARQDGAGRHRKIFLSEEMKAAIEIQKKSTATISAEDFKDATPGTTYPGVGPRRTENVPLSATTNSGPVQNYPAMVRQNPVPSFPAVTPKSLPQAVPQPLPNGTGPVAMPPLDPINTMPIPIITPGEVESPDDVGEQSKRSGMPKVIVDEFPLQEEVKRTSWEEDK